MQETAPGIETTLAFDASLNLQNAFGVSAQQAKTLSAEVAILPTAHAIGKSYDSNAKDKVNRLRVRQFWREIGK